MSANRDAKTLVVDEVRTRLDASAATLVTEYRGLTVAEMAALRRSIRAVGGDYKVFKNTLVRRAIEGSDHAQLVGLLEGPTAIAFVQGDVSAVAKALRDFARGAPALVIRGGVLDGMLLDAKALGALAELPSREVLLSMFAGALAAPMRTMAGLLKALPQNLAYGLAALVESKGGTRLAADEPATVPEVEAAVEQVEAVDAAAPEAEADADAEEGAEDAADEADPGTASDEAVGSSETDETGKTDETTDDGAETPAP